GTIRVDHIPAPEVWVGASVGQLQEQGRCRVAWIDRLGEGMLPDRDSVIQEGDMLHLVTREQIADLAYEVLGRGPEHSD
ncbi:MAG TPA: TrkA C-terminal domain-containing protein, partial [Nocardioides sp.]|nr:TrkA C-terminal domain-containing protein [Nocardioides sp.]